MSSDSRAAAPVLSEAAIDEVSSLMASLCRSDRNVLLFIHGLVLQRDRYETVLRDLTEAVGRGDNPESIGAAHREADRTLRAYEAR